MVWRTARRLNAALAGHVLTRCELRWPSLSTVDLTGRTVIEVVSTGKHLLLRLAPPPGASQRKAYRTAAGPGTAGGTDPEAGTATGADTGRGTGPGGGGDTGSTAGRALTLHSHLRMEGSWHVYRTGQRWTAPRPRHEVRAVLGNLAWTAVGHRLGMLDLVPTAQEARLVGHLGPDLLGPTWDHAEAVRRLAERPERAVGEALLDQRVLAGIGTFYMCEVLYLRGLTPWTPVAQSGDLDRLVELVRRMLLANRDRAVQSSTGELRHGREQWVHARSGHPCRRCGTTVRVAPIGVPPADRVAFFCPSCQSGPAPTDDGRPARPPGARPRRRPGP